MFIILYFLSTNIGIIRIINAEQTNFQIFENLCLKISQIDYLST